jgi:hypothetical protein
MSPVSFYLYISYVIMKPLLQVKIKLSTPFAADKVNAVRKPSSWNVHFCHKRLTWQKTRDYQESAKHDSHTRQTSATCNSLGWVQSDRISTWFFELIAQKYFFLVICKTGFIVTTLSIALADCARKGIIRHTVLGNLYLHFLMKIANPRMLCIIFIFARPINALYEIRLGN